MATVLIDKPHIAIALPPRPAQLHHLSSHPEKSLKSTLLPDQHRVAASA
jgi:hypothetical protein